MADTIADRLPDAVEARRTQLVELTMAFCAIPAENPPGLGLVESQQWITNTLADLDIEFEIHDTSRTDTDHRVIIGTIGDSGPSMYLHGHYDVVPAFDTSQFEPVVRDGSIVARGASDMKGGLIAMLVAALVHRDLGGGGRLHLVYVPDEESGGADGSERMSDLGLIDPTDCVGAIVGEPSHPDIWYAARGAFTVEVTVHGRPAHVGLHYNGANAFESAHAVIAELLTFRDEVAEHRTDFRIEPEAARSSVMLVGGLSSGGTNYNIVPDAFRFTIDRRPNPDEDYGEVRGALLSRLDDLADSHDITVEVLQDVEPGATAVDHPLVSAIERAVESVGGRTAPLTMCPGCLETRIYSRLGIPSVAYGPGPVREMHEPSEHVPVDNLVEAAAVYATVLHELCG